MSKKAVLRLLLLKAGNRLLAGLNVVVLFNSLSLLFSGKFLASVFTDDRKCFTAFILYEVEGRALWTG